jgi:hypothetical protein
MKQNIVLLSLILSLTFLSSFYLFTVSRENIWFPLILGAVSVLIVLFKKYILPLIFIATSTLSASLFILFLYNSLTDSFINDVIFILSLASIAGLNILGYRISVLYTKYKTWLIMGIQTLLNVTLLPLAVGSSAYSMIVFAAAQLFAPTIAIIISIFIFKKRKKTKNETQDPSILKPLPVSQIEKTISFKKLKLKQLTRKIVSIENRSHPIFVVAVDKKINVSKNSINIDGKKSINDVLTIIKNIQNLHPEAFSFKHVPIILVILSSKVLEESYTVEVREEALKDRIPHRVIVTSNINKVL